MAKKLDLPYPIVFGSKFPKLRFRVESGTQYVYSMTNYNLYITERDITESLKFTKHDLTEDGTFTIGALYGIDPVFKGGPVFVSTKGLTLPYCKKPCCMLLESWEEREFVEDNTPSLKLARVKLREKPELYECPLLAALLNCTSTDAERRFAEIYYTWAIAGTRPKAGATGLEYECGSLDWRFRQFIREWHKQQLHLHEVYRRPESVTDAILESLTAPALIPQVWLNCVYEPKRSPEEEKAELEYMPKRVDFLFIHRGQIHIVEVDDPSHYAKYDEQTRKYEVDEERYTYNLRAERALMEQGYQIHRMSNYEIRNDCEHDIIMLIRYALKIGLAESQAAPRIPGLKYNQTCY